MGGHEEAVVQKRIERAHDEQGRRQVFQLREEGGERGGAQLFVVMAGEGMGKEAADPVAGQDEGGVVGETPAGAAASMAYQGRKATPVSRSLSAHRRAPCCGSSAPRGSLAGFGVPEV